MGRKWEVRYVTYSSMVPFVSVALSEWGLGDLGPEPSREKSAVCNPNVTGTVWRISTSILLK